LDPARQMPTPRSFPLSSGPSFFPAVLPPCFRAAGLQTWYNAFFLSFFLFFFFWICNEAGNEPTSQKLTRIMTWGGGVVICTLQSQMAGAFTVEARLRSRGIELDPGSYRHPRQRSCQKSQRQPIRAVSSQCHAVGLILFYVFFSSSKDCG
jgi:hypothetical protein